VVDHQSHLPALDRENATPFHEVVLASAERQDLSLMAAWDLFKLLRSYLKNGWRHDHVKPLFYRNGRISLVPEHYEFVGVIERFIEGIGVVDVKVTEGKIRRGDRIAFELPVEFQEQDVDSLEIDN
jgi:hypothetical protein